MLLMRRRVGVDLEVDSWWHVIGCTDALQLVLLDGSFGIYFHHVNDTTHITSQQASRTGARRKTIIMFGILKFQTFLLVVLLFICSCTYLHGVFPTWLDRNKSG